MGGKDLNKRLIKLFQDDADPLNILRRKVASLFYAAQRVDFKVRFRDEIEGILRGEEVPEKKEVPENDTSSDSDEQEVGENSGSVSSDSDTADKNSVTRSDQSTSE